MNILFYSPYAGNWYLHTLWEGTIAHAVKHRGANVRFIGCDSAFRACDIFWNSTPRTEAGCHGCQQIGRQVFSQLGLESNFIGEHVTDAERAEINGWLSAMADGDLFDSHFDAYPVGEWCRASLVAHYRQPRFEPLSPEQAQTLRRYLEGAALAIRSLNRQLDAFRPELLVTLNGTFFSHRVAFELARERGIRVVVHERGMLPDSLLFNENQTIWARPRLQAHCETWRDVPLSTSELETAVQYLNDRRYGKRLAWHAFSPTPQPLEFIRRKLNIRPEQRVISLFTTSQSEAATSEWKGVFSDMIEWVTDTIEWFGSRPEFHLVVRIHPNEDHVQGSSTQVLDRYRAALKNLPENVSVIWPRDEVSSYSLVDLSSAVLVHDTTLGLESAATRGLPVGAVGNPMYRGWGFTFDLTDREQYGAFLEQIVQLEPSDEIRRAALRALYRLYFTLSIPFPQVSVVNVSHGQLNYSTLDELAPGRSVHLDRIADALLGETSFYPGPDSAEIARNCADEDAFFAENRSRPSQEANLPRVSVVAYIYNYAHYLDGAIQSILDQTYGDFEFFILDDGSTDGTPELVKKYLKDPRVRYEYQQNKGRDRLHETFNRCLEATSGEFVVIANGDDLMHPEKLQRQLEAFHADPDLEIVFHDATFINAAGETLPGSFDTGLPQEALTKRLLGRYMFKQNQVPNPTVMFRRSILRQIGLQEYGWAHDYQFWLKAAVARCRFRFLPERLICYRVHEESHSTSAVRRSRIAEEDRRMRREMRARYTIEELFPELLNCPDPRTARAYAHLEMGLLFCQGGLPMFDAAIAEFRQAVDLAPELLEARNNLALVLFLEGRRDEAVRIWRELADKHDVPEVQLNLRQALTPPPDGNVSFQLLQADVSPLPQARASLETDDSHEDFAQASDLAVLESSTTDDALLLAFKTYFASSAWDDVLLILTDAESQDERVATVFMQACQQIGLSPDNTPDVVLRQVKREELVSVFLGQLIEARHVHVLSDGPHARSTAELARERGHTPIRHALPKKQLETSAVPMGERVPLVSVIMPTYNRPEGLKRAIQSVLAQSFQDFEIVVVNDAGRVVEEVIASFAGESRITYIRHPRNKGLAAARNTGIRAARGKYLAYLDDDDCFYPDHLETLVTFLEAHPYRVAYSDAYRLHQEKVGDNYVDRGRDLPYSFDFDADRFLYENYVPVLCFVHERTCLDEVGLFDERLTTLEDWDLWIRLSRKYEFAHIPQVTCEFAWRHDGSTMTSSRIPEFWRMREFIFDKYQAFVEGKPHVKAQQDQARAWIQAQRVAHGLVAETPVRDSGLVSIVLLGYNQLAFTKLCVESVLAHSDRPFELILVDNGSVDGTGEYFRDLAARESRVKAILNPRNEGFAVGCNQGIAEATGDYVLFLNNDTIVPRNWLSRMLAHFEARPSRGAVGAVSNCVSGPQQLQKVPVPNHPDAWEAILAFGDEVAASKQGEGFEFPRLVGFCLMVRRKVLEQIGGFDPRYGIGNYEDDDLCLRIRTAGFETWVAADVYVHHFGSRTFAALGPHAFDDTMDQGWSRFKQKWNLPAHLDRRDPYSVILPVFDPRHHAIPLAETLPVDLADPFRPGRSALELHDRRQTAFIHHPDWSASTWPLVVSSFAEAFAAEDDVSLVIWLDPSQGIAQEEAGLRILDVLTQAGIDPEQAPDILLVPDILDLEGLARLYAATDCVVSAGNKVQADRAERLGLPVLDDLAPHAWHERLQVRGTGEGASPLNSAEGMPK